jgi:LacI family transcriptional regulator
MVTYPAARGRNPDPPTALFTGNGLVTMSAIDGMHGRAAVSPVALVSFDKFVLCGQAAPAVAQNPAAIGATAAQLVSARIGGDTLPARQVVLLTRLVARGSGEIMPLGKPGMPA